MADRVVAIHQPELLPWLGFMDKLRQCDVFVLLDHVPFEKNYFQNRNRIRTATPQGWSWLTVPVLLKGRFGQPIDEVAIDHRRDWRAKHLKTLAQHYHAAPAFPRYWPSLAAHYERSPERLVDFSLPLIGWLVESLGLDTPVVRSSELGVSGTRSALLLAICRKLSATEYLSGISGRDYLDVASFQRAGIAVRFQEFHHPIYRQCYQPFVPALSAVDLLFNYGEEAREILADARTPRLQTVFA